MSTEIIKVLDALAERFGIAIDWTQENIVPYLQMLYKKFITYEIATSAVWLVIGIIMTVIAIKLVRWLFSDDDDAEECRDEEGLAILIFLICIVLAASGLCIVGCQIFDIVTCLTFPEKMIFEYINTLTITKH